MRKTVTLATFLWLIIALALSGCGSEPADTPSQLDAARLYAQQATQTAQAAARPTNTPWPTAWENAPAAAAAATRTPTPSNTPWPTRDWDALGTVVPRDDYVQPAEWLTLPFTATDGQEHTLGEYLGNGIMLHTLTSTCTPCMDQQREVLAAIQDRYDFGPFPPMTFIVLSTSADDTPALLEARLQRALQDDWATVTRVQRPDQPGEYIIGVASEELTAALERAFGDEVSDPRVHTVIVVEFDGLAHMLADFSPIPYTELRNEITDYGAPPPTPAD